MLTHFDIETLNCVDLLRFQRSMPRVSNFQVNSNWEVIIGGRVVGDLDSIDFNEVWEGAPAARRAGARAKKRSATTSRRPAA